jgi:hypothetical protein
MAMGSQHTKPALQPQNIKLIIDKLEFARFFKNLVKEMQFLTMRFRQQHTKVV